MSRVRSLHRFQSISVVVFCAITITCTACRVGSEASSSSEKYLTHKIVTESPTDGDDSNDAAAADHPPSAQVQTQHSPGAQLIVREPKIACAVELPNAPSAAEITAAAGNAVAYIVALDALNNEVASGSGFVIDESGLLATNYHVLANAVRAYAKFKDGRQFEIKGYRAMDATTDLAIVELRDVPPGGLAYFDMGAAEHIPQGADVTAIGHPAGFDFTVTTGIVSAVRKTSQLPEEYRAVLESDNDVVWIQTSAAMSAGSSGGPLFSANGKVVGINTWVADGENLGFAIHVQHLAELLDDVSSECPELPFPGLGLVTEAKVAAVVYDAAMEMRQGLSEATSEVHARRMVNKIKAEYRKRLIQLAEDHPGSPTACQAICQAAFLLVRDDELPVRLDRSSDDDLLKILAIANQSHVADQAGYELSLALMHLASHDVVEYQKRVLDQTPLEAAKGVTCYSLTTNLAAIDGVAATLDPPSRAHHRAEQRALIRRALEEFGQVPVRGGKLEALAEPMLKRIEHLSVGSMAQNIAGTDLEGVPMSLDDFRGRVVLLEFWADWCPYCRDSYSQSRQLLDNFGEKGLVVLGVNADQIERARQVQQQGLVSWRSWSDGPEGPICRDWQIGALPTTYLIDRDGVIRFVDVRGPELEQAVRLLLADQRVPFNQEILAKGATWHYRFDVLPPDPHWSQPEFDDSGWTKGQAPLGFGQDGQQTTLRVGSLGTERRATAYFRASFQIDDPANMSQALLCVEFDDGAVVYINGQELARWNVQTNSDHESCASEDILVDGPQRRVLMVRNDVLKVGMNAIAVEVHQSSRWSADLHFTASISTAAVDTVAQILDDEQSPFLQDALGVVGELESQATAFKARLRVLVASKDESTALRTFNSLVWLSPDEAADVSPPPLRRWSDMGDRKRVANFLASRAWGIVSSPRRSDDDYQSAYRAAVLADKLFPKSTMIQETLALSHLRLNRHREALEIAETTASDSGPTAVYHAVVALARRKLGEASGGEHMAAAQTVRRAAGYLD